MGTRSHPSSYSHYYVQAHELDEARILNSRGHRLNPYIGVKFVQHNLAANIAGTDLTPDMVEEYDPLADLDTSQSVFDTASLVFLTTSKEHEQQQVDEETNQVCFTNTPYEETTEGSDHQHDEQDEEEEDDDDEGDEGNDTNDGEQDEEEEDGTDEEYHAAAVGDVFEQGYLKAFEE